MLFLKREDVQRNWIWQSRERVLVLENLFSKQVPVDIAINRHLFSLTLSRPWGRGGQCPRWLWTFITFSIFNQTLTNFARLSKIYQTCFSKVVIFNICAFVNEILTYCHLFRSFLHRFIAFEYFSLIVGGFVTFWKKIEIQDGGCLDLNGFESRSSLIFSRLTFSSTA